jgi:hypothetical protein
LCSESVFDVVQEKRGLLFCKDDRAILCRDCDVSVHTASELTMRHTRFLLTGVWLSAEPAACPTPPPSEDENSSDSFSCSAGDTAPPSAPATSSHSSDNRQHLRVPHKVAARLARQGLPRR